MDFFRAQDDARRRSRWLAVLFVVSMLCLLGISNLFLYLIFRYGANTSAVGTVPYAPDDPAAYLLVSALIILIVFTASVFKLLSLRKGGRAVAEMLNARLLVAATSAGEQRLLNVVEEMAIASGMPVPPVYIMEEPAINAFAAGHSTADAVIGVTRGAIDKLDRDQLQGVIAHEFSHILHGDMRLNLRLMGWLHGIMVLGVVGQYLVRAASASRRNNNNAGLAVLGLGLIVLGASGSFFGSLIKAAVSRQREYLADASAVQYTRNPAGISSALKRIAAETAAPYLFNPAAAQISHALFTEGVQLKINNLFATHPPLNKRIQALEPGWQPGGVPPADNQTVVSDASALRSKVSSAHSVAMAVARAGAPDDTDIDCARAMRASLPVDGLTATRDPQGAAALVSAILVAANPDDDRTGKYSALQAETKRLIPIVQALTGEQRLLLVNLSLPALRQLSDAQYPGIRQRWAQLTAPTSVNLSQWLLHELVVSHLDRFFGLTREQERHRELSQLQDSLSVFFSMLATSGHEQPVLAEQAFSAVRRCSGFESLPRKPASELTLQAFRDACYALSSLKPLAQKQLMTAMIACIYYDDTVTLQEHEIMRTVSEILGCPLPADINRLFA